MSEETHRESPNKTFWVIGYTALAWNVVGIISFLITVTVSNDALELMSVDERMLYTDVPVLINGVYAIAVFCSTLACVLLLFRKSLSVIVFLISLLAILVQMGYGIFISPLLEVRGMAALGLPLSVVLVASYLTWYSKQVKDRGWIS